MIILTILVFIFVLGLLVFVHELGHFIAAKRAGIKVEEFAFGFPPAIFKKKIGETTYAINLIPLGGYVKLYGEDGGNQDKKNSFAHKTVGQRFWVIFAGVLMNFILAWFLYAVGFNFGLPTTTLQPDQISGKVEQQVIITQVKDGSVAKKAGLEMGDTVISINNQKIENANQLAEITKSNVGKNIDIIIRKYGKNYSYNIKLSSDSDAPLGIGMVESTKVKTGFFRSIWYGLRETINTCWLIILAVVGIIKAVFTPATVSEAVTGPIGIWFYFQTALKLGWIYIAQLTALISANFAIINFFPFPALDGGRFVFLGIEFFRKKKTNPKIEAIIHSVGFGILILLMVLVAYRDIVKNLLK